MATLIVTFVVAVLTFYIFTRGASSPDVYSWLGPELRAKGKTADRF